MWELIEPHIGSALAFIIAAIFTFAAKKKWLNEDLADKLEKDVSGAVTAVYHEYVKARKDASEDGKLTDEEKKEARNKALAMLKSIGKEKGIDYAKTYGVQAVTALVEKYVTKNKAPKVEAPVVVEKKAE